jgi:rsbT antagonist protein RsbS
MHNSSDQHRVTINLMRGCLVANIQVDLNRTVLERFRKDLLERLDVSRSRRVILDCSGVELVDAEDFEALRRTIAMAALMGARTVVAGLQPGVVSALIDLDVDLDGLHTAQSIDDAFRLLETTREDFAALAEVEPEEDYDDVASQ